mmetsp:Transcript_8999/g.14433  ORF Transcript_8999/g.14433 Transcript_8999/m.14433 type:complete len:125 (-) Transcript_8999:445-819(-)
MILAFLLSEKSRDHSMHAASLSPPPFFSSGTTHVVPPELHFFLHPTTNMISRTKTKKFKIQRGHRPQARPLTKGESLKIRATSLRMIQTAQDATKISNNSRTFSISALHETMKEERISGIIEET